MSSSSSSSEDSEDCSSDLEDCSSNSRPSAPSAELCLLDELDGLNDNNEKDEQMINHLSWSTTNPLEVYSDFAIEVSSVSASSEQKKTTTYYVHRCVLVFAGDRKSGYFQRLFGTTLSVRENVEALSKIELLPAVAAAFPLMLDYIYFAFVLHPDKEDIKLSTSNAVPLRVLSKYFGVCELLKLVNRFITAKISSAETCVEYMIYADSCSDVQLIPVAAEACAKFFHSIGPDVIMTLSPEMLQCIVNAESFKPDDFSSLKYSRMLKKYMGAYPELSSSYPTVYKDLLSCKIMPVIHSTACIFFLLFDVKDKVYKCSCKKKRCLYDRCVKSYTENWGEPSLDLGLESLPIDVQNDLMRGALICARSNVQMGAKCGSAISSTSRNRKRRMNKRKWRS